MHSSAIAASALVARASIATRAPTALPAFGNGSRFGIRRALPAALAFYRRACA